MGAALSLICSRDGSLSLTKLAAATAHLLMAAAFVRLQVVGGSFDEVLWLVYGGFAITHAVVDKGSAQIAQFKREKLEAESTGGESK